MTPDQSDAKIAKLKDILKYLDKFDHFINEETWKDRFDTPLNVYLEQYADPNLKIFMDLNSSPVINTNSPLKKNNLKQGVDQI